MTPPPGDGGPPTGGGGDDVTPPQGDNVILLPGLAPRRPDIVRDPSRADRDDDDELTPEDLFGPLRGRPRSPSSPSDGGLGEVTPLEQSGPPPDHLIEPALEALLLAAEGPMTDAELDEWLEKPGRRRVREALSRIQSRMMQEQRGLRLVQVAKGWQLRTDVRFARWVAAMRGGKPTRLSKAALETLSVVAYRQPVTRAEIEDLRGVDSGGVLRMLCERDLATVVGRKDEPGRPLIYGTTPGFLSLFNLRSLSDLPTLRDLRALERDTAEGPAAGSPPTPKPVRRPADLGDLEDALLGGPRLIEDEGEE